MARVKRGVHARKQKRAVFKAVKGFRGGRSRLWRTAKEALDRARVYAYRDRKNRKRDFRRLWIIRINAASRLCGLSYSVFMKGLKDKNINLNRKILAYLAMNDFDAFSAIADQAKS